MTNEQWQSVWKLYQSGSSIPSEQLSPFLDRATADPEVRDAVLAMLGRNGNADALDRIGQKIGRYVLTARLGEGGMGEVYAARDLELGRAVAVKLLMAAHGTASPADRFIHEAKAASALNHPNIITIYEVIHAASRLAIVMELVDGMPLRQVCRDPLPLDRVLHMGEQIARALAAAHSRGIIHCDIKPENLMVRPDGFVKVMDFGLARDVASIGSSSLMPAGTLRYMSPEQSRGEPPSAASDVFSLGIVLYELAAGAHPFGNGSVFETLKAIHEAEPAAPSSRNAFVPGQLDALILRMLAKDPVERPSASDVARALETRLSSPALALPAVPRAHSPPPQSNGAPAPVPGVRRITLWRILAACALIGIAVPAIMYLLRPGPIPPEVRLDVVVPATEDRSSFALSPDGQRIAFAAAGDGVTRLWVRPLDSTSARPLPGTDGAVSPFWSPDSQSIGFFADYQLKRIDLAAEQPQILATALSNSPQGAWGRDGVIVFTPSGLTPMSRVPASGGQVTEAIQWTQHTHQLAPRFLPDGRRFLFVVNGADPSIWLGSLNGAPPRRITSILPGTDSAAEYLPPGWLVRVRQNILVAQRFDAEQARLTGDPIPLDQSARADSLTLAGSFSVSASGIVAWRSGGGGRRQLMWFNRAGKNVGAFGDVGDSTLFSPEISPDGKRVATMRGPVAASDIWVQEGNRNSRFTLDAMDNRYPIWSPDGKRIVFSSNRNGHYDLYEKAADGSGNTQALWQSAEFKRPNSWSPDGRYILYWSGQNDGDLMVLPLMGERKPFPFVSTPYDEQQGAFSPDGKWVAYQSDESGRFEIYVRPFPGPGGQAQVSAGGGYSPRWRADGKELYYITHDLKLMAVKVSVRGTAFTAGTAEPLFQTHINQATNRQQYDVARDGRFLILTDLPETSTEPIHLLLNWRPTSR